jgi:hypothetical protein
MNYMYERSMEEVKHTRRNRKTPEIEEIVGERRR